MRLFLLFTLGLISIVSSQAFSQLIPLDYYFDRLVGKQHFQFMYYQKEGYEPRIDGWLTGGSRDMFSYDIGHFVTWLPTLTDNNLWWYNNPPKISIRLNGNCRYMINGFKWHDNYDRRLVEDEVRMYQNTGFWLDQSLIYLKNGGVEYSKEKSLYTYLHGLSLNKGEYLFEGRLYFDIHGKESKQHLYQQIGQGNRWEHEFDYLRVLTSIFPRYGLSDRFEVGLFLYLDRRMSESENRSWISQSDTMESTTDDDYRYSNNELTVATYKLSPQVTFSPSPNIWLCGSVVLHLSTSDYKSEVTTGSNSNSDARTQRRYERDRAFYKGDLSITWVSKNQAIPYLQILDNYSHYYGRQLAARTLLISVDGSYQHSQYCGNTKAEEFAVYSEMVYYILRNFSFSNIFKLSRSMNPLDLPDGRQYYHRQIYSFQTHLDFYSYSWNQEERRDISWQKVSDIDYLLNPLLRQGNWHTSVSLYWPVNHFGEKQKDDRLFNIFKGDFGKNWRVSSFAKYGILDNLDAGITMLWQQKFSWHWEPHGDLFGHPTGYSWQLMPSISWQPTSYLRMNAEFTGEWYSYHGTIKHIQSDFSLKLNMVL